VLPQESKSTWEKVLAAFRTKWPDKEETKKTKKERITTLMEWKVPMADLGRKVKDDKGEMVWSHIKWTEGLEEKAEDAEDARGLLICYVYKALPEPLQTVIRHKQRDTYKELAEAVRGVNMQDLQAILDKHQRDEETACLVQVMMTPSKQLSVTLAATHLQPP
jgi:hypothetical protein